MEASAVRAGVDVGGTFTDVVVFDGGLSFGKVSTTPEAPEVGVLAALERMGLAPHELAYFVHGSTIALNAILERRGVKTALITTLGFRDVLEIMRTNRPDLYNLQQEKPVPLVPRGLRLEVRERIAADGTVLEPLVDDDVRAAASVAREAGVEAIAVCFINSYANDAHELGAKEVLERELPGITVTASSELVREWREFERTSTSVVNAYIRPLVVGYANAVSERFGSGGTPVYMMQSNGGLGTIADVRAQPAATIMSGPVGGVIATEHLAELRNEERLLTLDIGGTSADMCLITDGRAEMVSQREVERFPVLTATVDVHSIGAGGGSIAWIDRGGALRCGPQSAGAWPGPACYGRGGADATVTDAHVVLGRIDPRSFLGGEMPLDLDRARAAVSPIAEALGLSLEEGAAGIIRVIDLRMVEAVRRLAMRRGHDLRDFTLVPFGGAGALHGAQLCRELDISRMIVPVGPGTFSALGMLMADVRRDYAATNVLPVSEGLQGEIETLFAGLEQQALRAAGDDRPAIVRAADMRYEGQEFTVTAPAPATITAATLADLTRSFEEAHERLYGYRLDGQRVLLVTARVSAVTRGGRARLAPLPQRGDAEVARKGEMSVFDVYTYEWQDWPRYDRAGLPAGARLEGPAIIEEAQSTTVVGAGDIVEVDDYGNLLVEVERSR